LSLQPERAKAQPDGVMGFMPFYYQRFAWSTRGWPAEAALAYIYLLCEQYAAGSLDPDPNRLEEIAPGTVANWDRIGRKFTVGPDGRLRNQRCEDIRERSIAEGDRRRQQGRNAAARRWQSTSNPSAMLRQCSSNAPAMPNDANDNDNDNENEIDNENQNEINQTHLLNGDAVERDSVSGNNERGRRRRIGTDEDFDSFWDIYPRRVGKGAARLAFFRALPLLADEMELIEEAAARHMIRAVEAYANRPDTRALEPKFVPHPATWLNQKRYIDELERIREEQLR
jgi:uncharacterized protein YdaU (DUF1376 family)